MNDENNMISENVHWENNFSSIYSGVLGGSFGSILKCCNAVLVWRLHYLEAC